MNILKVVYFYFKGLNRNFKIIKYGDVPSIYNSPAILERYAFADGSVKSYFLSVFEMAAQLLRDTQKIYVLPSGKVAYCGGSKNNEREFDFFASIMSEVEGCQYEKGLNLSFVPSAEKKKLMSERLLSFVLFIGCAGFLFRVRLGPVSLKYLIVYSKVFLQLISSCERQELRARLMVVANDHTDFPVVASMVMQYYRVPVLYVQHAEISHNFPPLDFDVSILRNVKSLQKYEAIGKVRGDIYVVPRSGSSGDWRQLSRTAKRANAAVVIYLSSVFDVAEVLKCVSALLKNDSVSQVGVKPHPRADISLLCLPPQVFVYSSIPEFEHIAVVPNSSVVIELLEHGVPVFQYFDLDEVAADYYGFVRENITKQINLDDMNTPFWLIDFYESEWLSRFKIYSPAADESWRASLPVLMRQISSYLAV